MEEVWIVHAGCRYEGGSTKAVCSSRQRAIWYARYIARRDKRTGLNKYRRISEPHPIIPSWNNSEVPCEWQQKIGIMAEYCAYPRIDQDVWYDVKGSDIMMIFPMKLL